MSLTACLALISSKLQMLLMSSACSSWSKGALSSLFPPGSQSGGSGAEAPYRQVLGRGLSNCWAWSTASNMWPAGAAVCTKEDRIWEAAEALRLSLPCCASLWALLTLPRSPITSDFMALVANSTGVQVVFSLILLVSRNGLRCTAWIFWSMKLELATSVWHQWWWDLRSTFLCGHWILSPPSSIL